MFGTFLQNLHLEGFAPIGMTPGEAAQIVDECWIGLAECGAVTTGAAHLALGQRR